MALLGHYKQYYEMGYLICCNYIYDEKHGSNEYDVPGMETYCFAHSQCYALFTLKM